jgi:hypothetical protein
MFRTVSNMIALCVHPTLSHGTCNVANERASERVETDVWMKEQTRAASFVCLRTCLLMQIIIIKKRSTVAGFEGA